MAATAVAALAIPTVAVAHGGPVKKTAKVRGGQTVVELSGLAGLTLTPLGKATVSGTQVTFPIARGRTNAAVTRGVIVHRGGVALSKDGARTVRLRRPVAVVTKRAKFLAVQVGGRRTIRAFQLRNLHKDGTTITATLKLTPRAAKLLNRAFGTALKAGANAGTATTTLG